MIKNSTPLRLRFIAFALLISLSLTKADAQPTQYVHKVVLQGFWWDYWNSNYRYNWCNYLTDLAPRLKKLGVDAIWIPPCVKNGSGGSVGYSPFDPYDLGDKYQKGGGDGLRDSTRCGTKDDLLRMIAVMHSNGIEVIFDAVINHNDGAGSNSNAGGIDPEPTYSLTSNSGYKNFRYVSYKTPIINDSLANDYFSRSGRWAKNYQNFHLNPANTFCASGAGNAGDICGTFFGPDIDYETAGALGQSTNIPTSGNATINGVSRPFYNPVQTAGADGNYMHTNTRAWMKWFKRQTNVDGYRFDAVKHFPINVQQNVVTDMKYNLPDWCKGGQDMFCIGEWVAGASQIDSYVGSVALPAGTPAGEEAVGAFDFSLRGYGTNGGIYSMVLSGGSYNMQNLQNDRQSKRWMDYGNKRVYRTSPFVNSHDTYRPKLDSVGKFLKPLGDASGWGPNELGGNGQHIDPREPRLAAAYAAAMAFNGNPIIYFEDIFDIGTTGKRWSHLPTSETDLPIRADLVNIINAHQKLGFKDADEYLPTNYSGGTAPVYNKGTAADHFVIERKGKAIIGITDAYSSTTTNTNDQEVWISVADATWYNKNLIDYSGAHGLTTTQVFSDGRVLIKTAPAGHNIQGGARGHGYSIWAPLPDGVTFPDIDSMYRYLASYTPPRNPETTQEWEMADDLGDSHCNGLGQGGALPTNATNERVAGRIYAAAGSIINVILTPEVDGRNITFAIYDNRGNVVNQTSGVAIAADPLSLFSRITEDGWYIIKVRNTNDATAGQKVWLKASYTAPKVVDTKSTAALIPTDISIWTGNKGTNDVSDCGNWEGGKVPGTASTVIVYGHAKPFPIVTNDLTINKLYLYNGAQMTVNPDKKLTILSQ